MNGGGQDSAVGIATRYGLEGPGIESKSVTASGAGSLLVSECSVRVRYKGSLSS
jgi:hypothetical protein